MPKADTVIVLTALDVEYKAVRRYLTDLEPHVHPAGTRFEVGTVPGGTCKVALALVGKGNQPAAVLAERARSEFEPVALVFAGIAGKLYDKLALGDVVVATHVYAYHGGTSSDSQLSARPRVWEAPHHLEQLARQVARTGAWSEHLRENSLGATPKAHFAPIAAGEVVHKSRVSGYAQWLEQHYNDAAAIEMEGAGAAQAGHLGSTPTLVVRGISDSATPEKDKSEAGWRVVAADHAAAFAVALIAQIPVSGRSSGTRASSSERIAKESAVGAQFTNVAKDHAVVGAQFGQVLGDVWVGGDARPGGPLSVQLAELRKAVNEARNTGHLDSETYSAAEAELQLADSCLPATADSKRSKLVLALRRLKGLVEHVTSLAAKVTTILDGLR